jgi:alkanesulfonate monooxygenase SsuD/methylene tetrahydromethanopterin reductase-like flavin-dependent oxidoreductase (luciferase family)
MRFGVYLPTFAWRDLRLDQAARVKAFARRAEGLGFDALWVAEHFLEAPGLYGTVWMSPLLCLAHAASVTMRIRLRPRAARAVRVRHRPAVRPLPIAHSQPSPFMTLR